MSPLIKAENMYPNPMKLLDEQAKCVKLRQSGMTLKQIAAATNMSFDAVRRRLRGAEKLSKLDPVLASKLLAKGLTDLDGLHSGWLLDKDKDGSGQSLYFYLGKDEEKISFVDALMEVMEDIPRLPQIDLARPVGNGRNFSTWIALADLHVGGDYGNLDLEQHFNHAIDDLVERMPPAEEAVLLELGDLFEANDHKGVTPASGNMLDVRREDFLKNTLLAFKLIRRATYRLLETHLRVKVHFIKGNHDPTAYVAVMMAMAEHFADNERVEVVVSDADFRVIQWGQTAVFPNHGHELNWVQLKDVWTDQFPDEWAEAKIHRLIATAHFHHDRRKDLIGCVGEHYRTIHKPNNWAKGKGMFSRGSITSMTIHKDRGEEFRTISNILPNLRGA